MTQLASPSGLLYPDALANSLARRTAPLRIGRLGYGLSLAVEFSKAGFQVNGIDVPEAKMAPSSPAAIGGPRQISASVPNWARNISAPTPLKRKIRQRLRPSRRSPPERALSVHAHEKSH